ncbi:MAG: flagellar basal body rod C-terminal domain-containing protein [Candidatus Solibacter sp.]
MSITGAALGGMQDAQSKLERKAEKLAPPGRSPDTGELAGDMVELLSAGHQFALNARVLQTADEMQKKLIDIFA